MNSSKLQIKIKQLQMLALGLIFILTGAVAFVPAQANAAVNWVANPASCPQSDPANFPGQNCAPNNMCGDSSGIAQCYNTASIPAPAVSIDSSTLQASLVGGGYVINCFTASDAGTPYCDNNGAAWCNRAASCYGGGNNRLTTCLAGHWASEGASAYTCGACLTTHLDCTGDTKCEVQKNVTTYPTGGNNHYGNTCDAVDTRCNTNYYDCDATGVTVGNGCEAYRSGACTGVGGLTGTWSCAVDAGGTCTNGGSNYTCTCVTPKCPFESATLCQYFSSDPLLWGKQLGSGELIRMGNSNKEDAFVVENDGSIRMATTSAPGDTTGLLYNVGGDLYWDGALIGASASSSDLDFQQVTDLGNITTNWIQFAGGTSTADLSIMGNLNVSGDALFINATGTNIAVAEQFILGQYAVLPAAGYQAGAMVFSTADSVPYFWDGSTWIAFATGTGAGDLQAVTDLGNTTTNWIEFAGGTSTGNLSVIRPNDEAYFTVNSGNSDAYLDLIGNGGATVLRMSSNGGANLASFEIASNGSFNMVADGTGVIWGDAPTGNVGINLNSPQYTLEVAGVIRAWGQLVMGRSNLLPMIGVEPGAMLFRSIDASAHIWNGSQWNRILTFDDLDFAWNLAGNVGTDPNINFVGNIDAQPLVFRTENLERMRLDENGRLGLGTSTPAYLLDVYGDARVNSQFMLGQYALNPLAGLQAGSMIYNTASSTPFFWDGSSWIAFATGTGAGDLQAVTDLGNITTNWIEFAGGTSTNDLIIRKPIGETHLFVESGDSDAVFALQGNAGATEFRMSSNAGGKWASMTVENNGSYVLAADGQLVAFVDALTSSFGVGESSPLSKLHVTSGSVSTTAIATYQNAIGDYQTFNTEGSPEGHVTGSVGDLATDVVNGRLFIKETGHGTNTGWVALAGAGVANSIWDGDFDTGIQVEESADEDIIRFDVAGNEVMRIDPTPGEPLVTINSTLGSYAKIFQNFYDEYDHLQIRAADVLNAYGGDLVFNFNPEEGFAVFYASMQASMWFNARYFALDINNNKDAIRVDENAFVGLSTSTPMYRLDVAGDVRVSDQLMLGQYALNPLAGLQAGAMIYNTASSAPFFWNGTGWKAIASQDLITLDRAYDGGGSGAGRQIIVDSGPVHLTGAGSGTALQIDYAGSSEGFILHNFGSGAGISLSQAGTGLGMYIRQNNGFGIQLDNNTANDGFVLVNGSTGNGINVKNSGTGNSLYITDELSDSTPFVLNSSGSLGIGTAYPNSKLQISDDNSESKVSLLRFQATNNSEIQSEIYFSAGGNATYWDVNSGNEGGALIIMNESTQLAMFAHGGVVINENGDDYVNFRVESDRNTHALFVDSSSGNVGFDQSNPLAKLHIGNNNIDTFFGYDFLRLQAGEGIDHKIYLLPESNLMVWDYNFIGDGGAIEFRDADTEVGLFTNIGLVINEGGVAGVGLRVEGDTVANLLYTDAARDRVGIGTDTPDARFHATQSANTVAVFDRTTNDGTIISLRQAGIEEGTISVSGNTVSYNAFTGSHYAWTNEIIEHGMLVSLTGDNRHLHDNIQSEIVYGVSKTAIVNDSKVMGSYLALQESNRAYDASNPHLVMAVGNGEVWVADKGENINVGDHLISSDVMGHAQKDTGEFIVSHIVAKAAESINWSNVAFEINGVKHKKISVFFESFDKSNMQSSVAGTSLQGGNSNLDIVDLAVGSAVFEGNVTVMGHVMLSRDAVGQAMILIGENKVTVSFEMPYDELPIITATPYGAKRMDYGVENVSLTGFDIVIDPIQYKDTIFNWHAFGNREAKVFVSNGTTLDVEMTDMGTSKLETQINANGQTAVPAPVEEVVEAPVVTEEEAVDEIAAETEADQAPSASEPENAEQTVTEEEAPAPEIEN